MKTLAGSILNPQSDETTQRWPTGLRVFIVEPQGSGGNWHYANALTRTLMAAGMQVALGTLAPVERSAHLGELPIRIIGSDSRAGRWSAPGLVLRIFSHVGNVLGLLRAVNEFRPHIVHFHGPMGQLDFLYMRILKAGGSKIVFTAHEPRPVSGKVTGLDWARYREADAVLVHSENGVDDLVSAGVDRGRVVRIFHANYTHLCDESGLSRLEARELLGLPDSARVLLFFGGIAPYKGLDILIEAFSKAATADSSLHLVIAGGLRMDFSEYQQAIDRLASRDRVLKDLRYIPLGEFAKFFVACDVVVLPYRRIYQSGVLQLAYGFARPVVVTNVGGISDSVLEDQTGVVARSVDADALADAITDILSDPERARMMGWRARHLAETKYSWESVASSVAKVYESVCADRRGSRNPS